MTNLPNPPTEVRPAAYVNMHANGVLDTRWADHIARVVIDTAGIAIHLDLESAAQLAADLIHAVAESGAGQVPDVLLHAFDAAGGEHL